MNKKDKIIQYHLDNNLNKVSDKFSDKLSYSEKKQINSAIKLNQRLRSLRVKESFGKESFKSIIIASNESVSESRKISFSVFKYVSLSMSVLIFVVALGGFSFSNFKSKQGGSETAKISSILTNGTVENVNKVNLVDMESEQSEISKEASVVSSVKADLGESNNMAEAINENF